MRKIAFLGGPGTGKSTLIKALDVEYSMAGWNSSVCLEFVREYIASYGVPESIFEQFMLYEGQKRREQEYNHCDIIFCDNSTILNFIYGLMSCNYNDPKQVYALTLLFTWAIKDLAEYEIFYLPREFDLTEDGIRYQAETEAAELDKRIKALLDMFGVPYTEITGDLNTRVEKVKAALGFEPRNKQHE